MLHYGTPPPCYEYALGTWWMVREREQLIYDFDFGHWDVRRNIPTFTKCR